MSHGFIVSARSEKMNDSNDLKQMRRALSLAKRAFGQTSPNPMVGAVIVSGGTVIGEGYHRRAGEPHAEVEAIRNAQAAGHSTKGATIYVTLEPCSTHGRTPPCCDAIIVAGIRKVIVAAVDPNPAHAGRGLKLLRRRDIEAVSGLLAPEATRLNEGFNHWIQTGRPFVLVKTAMTLDGKIATESGESKWITGANSRSEGMRLRMRSDAILVGVNTIIADDPELTVRDSKGRLQRRKKWLRVILDPRGRTPRDACVVRDELAGSTLIVTGSGVSARRGSELWGKNVRHLRLPLKKGRLPLDELLSVLGREQITQVLVEGGGETNALFFENGLVNRVGFFYASKILGGRTARRGVAGASLEFRATMPQLLDIQWKKLGPDLMMTGLITQSSSPEHAGPKFDC